MYAYYQGLLDLFHGVMGLMITATLLYSSKQSGNVQIRHMGYCFVALVLDYFLEGAGFLLVRTNPLLSGFVMNIVAQLFLHLGLAIGLIPVINMLNLKNFSKWAIMPMVSGIIAAAFGVINLQTPWLSPEGFVSWYRDPISEFLTVVTTMGTGIITSYLFFSKLLLEHGRGFIQLILIGVGLLAIAFTGPIMVFNQSVFFFWFLNVLHFMGFGMVLLALLVIKQAHD